MIRRTVYIGLLLLLGLGCRETVPPVSAPPPVERVDPTAAQGGAGGTAVAGQGDIRPQEVVGADPGPILGAIERLEGTRDPKCHATASRLEDFIYGTPLTAEARFYKNQQQRTLAWTLWSEASAAHGGRGLLERSDLPSYRSPCEVTALDAEHYGSIAYSLRALLGAWLDTTVGIGEVLPPLTPGSVESLSDRIDQATLCALKRADERARREGTHRITKAQLTAAWAPLSGPPVRAASAPASPLVSELIARKVAAYQAYNEVSNTLFIRNMQVYFAKARWPETPDEAQRFRQTFTETVIAFGQDLSRQAADYARARNGRLIREADVYRAAQNLAPYTVNQFEDVTYFPHRPLGEQVTLESYDLDAFRDSGLHWRYLGFGLESLTELSHTFDPLAAELVTENIAQFGVLILRLAGGYVENDRLSLACLGPAMQAIRDRRLAESEPRSETPLSASAITSADGGQGASFVDVSEAVGVSFAHRSSDWLSRLLRGVLQGRGAGNPTIPPAFGGAGLAARDVDGDGWEDLLLLSGSGNRLYRNRAGQGFEDVTDSAGITWRRTSDRRPGEPRQPLFADLDNDGDQDLVITYVNDTHRVYRNDGKGRFEDMTSVAKLGGEGLVGGPATVFDMDGDGLLDIYIVYFGDYVRGVLPTLARTNTNGLPNRLFRNRGDFRFEDVTERSGVADTGWGQSVTHTDLNGDGAQDLIVGNDFGVNRYFVAQENGPFVDRSVALGTDKPSYTMGFGLTDLNGDQRPELYVSNIVVMVKDERYVLPNEDTPMRLNPAHMARARVVEANDLFLSQPEGTYRLSENVGRGYSTTGWSWGADFFDADHDGDDDLYVLNGMNEFRVYGQENPYYADAEGTAMQGSFPPAAAQANVFFENTGGKLVNASEGSGLDRVSNGRSFVAVDYDHDGDLDVITLDYHGPAIVYQNLLDAPGSQWLQVTLEGDVQAGSARDAVGAVVTAKVGDRLLWRQVTGSRGYQSVSPRALHFGLGTTETVELSVRWPSGAHRVYPSVRAGQRVVLREAQAVQ